MSGAATTAISLQSFPRPTASASSQSAQAQNPTAAGQITGTAPTGGASNQQSQAAQNNASNASQLTSLYAPSASTTTSPAQPYQAPSPGHQRETIFHFRSERAQWLASAAVVISLAALILTWVYSAKSLELAEWEAEKDFYEYCQDLKSSPKRLPSQCIDVSNRILRPPPGHTLKYFVAWLPRIRRALSKAVAAAPESSNDHADSESRPLLFGTIYSGFLAVLAWGVWIDYEEDEQLTGAPKRKGILGVALPLVIRLFPILLRLVVDYLGKLNICILLVLWLGGHAWATFHTTGLLAGHYGSILHIWTLCGLCYGIFPEHYFSFVQLFLRILCIVAVVQVANKDFLNNMDRTSGTYFARKVWTLAYYASQIGGILFLCDTLWACRLAGKTRFGSFSDKESEPLLPTIIVPTILLWLLFYVAHFCDAFGPVIRYHLVRHVGHRTRRFFETLWAE